jgi:lambda family phage minor tail protein L
MKATDENFIAQKNASQNKPIWLFNVLNYDGAGSNFPICTWDIAVTFGGVTYNPFPCKLDFLSNNTQNQIDSLQLTCSNVSRVLQSYLEAYDLRGCAVNIQVVFIDTLTDASAYLKDVFYIDSYTADANNVVFTLTSAFNVNDLDLPSRKFLGNFCSWIFKGTECGYTGSTPTCNRTANACQNMNGGSNYSRFGGFPGIPTERIIVS